MIKPPHPIPARVLRSIAGITIAVLIVLVSSSAWLPALGRWLAMPVPLDIHRVDAIIVHGGGTTRTLYGMELYHRGLASELWHTGYASSETEYTEIAERIVPSQSFHYLITTSTWTDGQQIVAAIRARKLHSVIIVTDWWHSRRALCSTEQQLQGYDVAISFEPSPAPVGPSNWWQNAEIRGDVLDELVKLGYYTVRYGMTPWGC